MYVVFFINVSQGEARPSEEAVTQDTGREHYDAIISNEFDQFRGTTLYRTSQKMWIKQNKNHTNSRALA